MSLWDKTTAVPSKYGDFGAGDRKRRFSAANFFPAHLARLANSAAIMFCMTDVTQILKAIEQGDPSASDELLPLVYEELRALARQRLAHEKPGQTLQATALVHEAYLRLVGNENDQSWDNRGHFFAAAAEAMRRILIQNARRKRADKRGGQRQRQQINDGEVPAECQEFDILSLNEAIDLLAEQDAPAAELAKLRIFAGLSVDEAGAALGLPHTTAYRQWTYAQAWLRARLNDVE